jgi:endonuclease-3
VRNHQAKIGYLTKLAPIVGTDEAIPTTHAGLTALPGLGPKSANVILRESHLPAEGIIVDLHVIRVAPRLGMALGTDGNKIEKQLKALLAPALWGEAGMALSFLGREICRPTNPLCPTCPVQSVCPSRRPL